MSTQQEMMQRDGFGAEGDLLETVERDEQQRLAEFELATDPSLVRQLEAIDAAFATEAGRNLEMTQDPIERRKDGFTQGGWARG